MSAATTARGDETLALVNAVATAPTWEAAEARARARIEAAEVAPRHILEQAAGSALLMRSDFLVGLPTPAETEAAERWLTTLNRNRYAHLPDLLRLTEAVRHVWSEERVRDAAERALASDREWQIRRGTFTQLLAMAAVVGEGVPQTIPQVPGTLPEAEHGAARRALAALAE